MHETESPSDSASDESDGSIQPLLIPPRAIPTAAGFLAERSADPKPEPEPGSGPTSAKASAVTQSKPHSTTKALSIPISRHRPFGPDVSAFYDREGFAASVRSHYGDVIGADRCAGGGKTCKCKGGGTVHFGQMGRWLSKKLVPTFRGGPPWTGGIECTAQAMGGDPCPGYNKGCWCTEPDDRRALWPGSPPHAGHGLQGQASALLPARPAIGGPGHHAALRFNPHVWLVSVGSTVRPQLHEAQRLTLGQHFPLHTFTEDNVPECVDCVNWDSPDIHNGEHKGHPPGWWCAQTRGLAALEAVLNRNGGGPASATDTGTSMDESRGHGDDSAERLPLPMFLLLIDDDTFVHPGQLNAFVSALNPDIELFTGQLAGVRKYESNTLVTTSCA